MSLAVRIVSLLLTLTIFLLAALHVAYLVAAFDAREEAGRTSQQRALAHLLLLSFHSDEFIH